MERIDAASCKQAIDWLRKNPFGEIPFEINSLGGETTPEFYELLQVAQNTLGAKVIAKKAHSSAALLFVSFQHRLIMEDGEVVFKSQRLMLDMLLKQAANFVFDGNRYKREYDLYSRVFRNLLRKTTKLSEKDISAVLERGAVIPLFAKDALSSCVATGIIPTPLTYDI